LSAARGGIGALEAERGRRRIGIRSLIFYKTLIEIRILIMITITITMKMRMKMKSRIESTGI